MVFGPCTAGELLKWKVIVVLPFDNAKLFAGSPFTEKSLASRVGGSASPFTFTRKSVGRVETIVPQMPLVTEQGVEVGVGVGVGVASCISNEPMSMRLFTTRLNPGPR